MKKYTMYEMPGNMICGNCGQVMLAATCRVDAEMLRTGKATFECVDNRCSDHGHAFTVNLKKHISEGE